MKSKKISVLVVDDESIVREGISSIILSQNDMKIIGEARDGVEAVELANKFQPDVILLDTDMPRQNGLTTIPILKEKTPRSSILILSSFIDAGTVYQAIKSGALGFMLKDVTRGQLLQAIRDVSAGQASISKEIALKVIQEIEHPSEDEETWMMAQLTQRELDILRLLARGMDNQGMANTLFLSQGTVSKYISTVLMKLHFENRTQAALFAIQKGFGESSIKIDSPGRLSMNFKEQRTDIFVSYARADIDAAQEIYHTLYLNNHRPWMDVHSIKGGENWLRAIYKAINESEIFLAILSNNSVSKRGVIQKELKKALDKWEGMLPEDIYILPIRIDDCPIPELMKDIQVLDWNDGKGSKKLLEAIRTGKVRRNAHG